MVWLQLIVGGVAIVVAGLQYRRPRRTPVAWPAEPWIGVAIGASLVLTAVAELTGSITLIAVAAGGSVLCMGAVIVLVYRQYQRNIGRHLNDLEAKRKS